ncbi:endoribonuclease L-PSP [Xylaria bambusicola]|uniref:endoribonuclease L-PSP n=1 Tax=Xylaria bambusicola TaxID=326684 RepID=UPI0020086586|nr:endoribonuclease L-PSP [Xylaria bambusicola]KAI0512514.1 endoribonuclease L-PSP [Xylaria bambusicola]
MSEPSAQSPKARTLISSGSAFEEQIGYSRAVVTGDFIFVSGCTGYDYKTGAISPDIVEQAEQCLVNVASALAEADSSIEDVVRVTYTVPEREAFPKIWPVTRKWFGNARPAATMISAGLMKEEMKLEIEVTAVKGSARK